MAQESDEEQRLYPFEFKKDVSKTDNYPVIPIPGQSRVLYIDVAAANAPRVHQARYDNRTDKFVEDNMIELYDDLGRKLTYTLVSATAINDSSILSRNEHKSLDDHINAMLENDWGGIKTRLAAEAQLRNTDVNKYQIHVQLTRAAAAALPRRVWVNFAGYFNAKNRMTWLPLYREIAFNVVDITYTGTYKAEMAKTELADTAVSGSASAAVGPASGGFAAEASANRYLQSSSSFEIHAERTFAFALKKYVYGGTSRERPHPRTELVTVENKFPDTQAAPGAAASAQAPATPNDSDVESYEEVLQSSVRMMRGFKDKSMHSDWFSYEDR